MTARPTELVPKVAAALINRDPDTPLEISAASGGNRTWRVAVDGQVFFVKAHTRPWYDWSPLEAAAQAVGHEAAAYQILADAGLATPDVVVADSTADNPLGWPCLILRGLPGTPLPVIASTDQGPAALAAAGAYLAAAHRIVFRYPGYLVDGPPTQPLSPDGYIHPICTPERSLANAFATWTLDRDEVGNPLIDRVAGLALDTLARLRAEFEPPRFVTGDCHASQIFLTTTNGTVAVSGMVDMEVASAGTPLADLFKLTVELAGRLPAATGWWNPLLAGYDRHLDFDLVRLAYLMASHENYSCYGPYSWPGTRAQILAHILDARGWDDLFDLTHLPDR